MATAMEVQTMERGGSSPLQAQWQKIAASGLWLTPGEDAVAHAAQDSCRVLFGPGLTYNRLLIHKQQQAQQRSAAGCARASS